MFRKKESGTFFAGKREWFSPRAGNPMLATDVLQEGQGNRRCALSAHSHPAFGGGRSQFLTSAGGRCYSLHRRNLEAGTGIEPVFTDLQSGFLSFLINMLN
ncbi:MAG: hypothetical protein IOD05_08635 [Rhodobacter sp.]|nr:hypothetical protein [Rhodobacter sp.]MCA3492098.1 hypothetical protein [Rhodobacter sp.]MCA3500352.1 hypothetical protein [Rhodobacter sp.]MCA3503299.1 hypothetical protein [Rhodobacter sp.]MCA3517619.1 hypothetical protein [Rhodobacter sp.]